MYFAVIVYVSITSKTKSFHVHYFFLFFFFCLNSLPIAVYIFGRHMWNSLIYSSNFCVVVTIFCGSSLLLLAAPFVSCFFLRFHINVYCFVSFFATVQYRKFLFAFELCGLFHCEHNIIIVFFLTVLLVWSTV